MTKLELKEEIDFSLKLWKLSQKDETFEGYWKAIGGLNGWQPPHILEIIGRAKTEEDIPRLLKKFWQM